MRPGFRWLFAVLALALPCGFPGRASGGSPTEGSSPLARRFAAIEEAQQAASRRFHDELQAAKEDPARRQEAVDRYLVEVARNTNAALDLVRAHPRDPANVDALRFVIRTARAGPGNESEQALEILARDHVRAPKMGELCEGIFYFVHLPVAESLIRAVVDQNPNREDRALACHALATYLRTQARMVRRVRDEPARLDEYVHERHKEALGRFVAKADPEALEREALTLLERVVLEFGNVPFPYDHRTLGDVAAGELFALRSLGIGKVAPEIEGRDHEGRSFRLSDARGKVVVLIFSGHWCGPCRGMYPQERDLVARRKGQPFALLSVNTDRDKETLRTAIAAGEITWRCWWDGGTDGPITTRWGVASFPSIFVLDRAGVIRFKDVRGEALDDAVERLLAEGTAPTSPR